MKTSELITSVTSPVTDIPRFENVIFLCSALCGYSAVDHKCNCPQFPAKSTPRHLLQSVQVHKKSYLSPDTIENRCIGLNYCNSLLSSLTDPCRKGCLQSHSLEVWLYHCHVGVQSVYKPFLPFHTQNTK